jgi:ferric-dicitrate binding protein FerR (iron transport regulator)
MSELNACPDQAALERFQRGEAGSLDPEALAAHLEQCPRCARALETLDTHDSLCDSVRAQAAQTPADFARTGPGRPRRGKWLALVAALAAVAAIIVGIVLALRTPMGEVEVSSDDPNVQLIVEDGSGKETILHPGSKQIVSLEAGTYRIKLGEGGQGFTLSTDRFTLARNGKAFVTIRRSPRRVH